MNQIKSTTSITLLEPWFQLPSFSAASPSGSHGQFSSEFSQIIGHLEQSQHYTKFRTYYWRKYVSLACFIVFLVIAITQFAGMNGKNKPTEECVAVIYAHNNTNYWSN
jgi:hypothetical protein